MQMRINPNKKVHKIKRDPYKVLAKLALILAVCVVAGVGIFYLCSKAVERDYVAKRDQIDQMNEENEVEFNTRLNELRAGANSAFSDPISGDTVDENLPSWEKTLDGKVWRVEDEGKTGLENVSTVTMSRSELLQGGLVLINPWHSVPSDYSYEGLLSVGSNSNYKIPVTDNTVQLFPAAYNGLLSLINRCTEAGYDSYIVRQGYRSNEEQTKLFEDAMQRLSSQYSGDILIEQTKKDVNYPGTSEYQSGFAFQMGLYNRDAAIANTLGKFSEDKRGQYFIENCWKDGIVFRFPVDGFPRSDWETLMPPLCAPWTTVWRSIWSSSWPIPTSPSTRTARCGTRSTVSPARRATPSLCRCPTRPAAIRPVWTIWAAWCWPTPTTEHFLQRES